MVREHQVQVGIRTVLVSLSLDAFFSYRGPVVVYLSVARSEGRLVHGSNLPDLDAILKWQVIAEPTGSFHTFARSCS